MPENLAKNSLRNAGERRLEDGLLPGLAQWHTVLAAVWNLVPPAETWVLLGDFDTTLVVSKFGLRFHNHKQIGRAGK